MEENKIVEVKDEGVTEVKKESTVVKGLKKVGTGIKNNWKTIAVGAAALIGGIWIGSRRSGDNDDYEVADDDPEIVEITEVNSEENPE